MAKKYLDYNGVLYFWGKLKAYFQVKLVSGTNIKTINNESVLGSGNISVPTALSDLTNDMVVSDFTNDAGYLTAHQDISGKANKTDTDIDSSVKTLYASLGWVQD